MKQSVINKNVAVIAQALAFANAQSVEVTYSGGGESSTDKQMKITWEHDLIPVFIGAVAMDSESSVVENGFKESLFVLLDQMMDFSMCSDFNSGIMGAGRMVITSLGKAELHHSNFIENAFTEDKFIEKDNPLNCLVYVISDALVRSGNSMAVL